MGARTRKPQPLLIRITHWLCVPVIVVMAMSGLEILRAYPYFGPVHAPWSWVPLSGWEAPSWSRAGHWLAGARQLHLALAWLLVANALVYVGYLVASGEWRRRYVGRRRIPYALGLGLGVLEVLSGLALWKPVQLHRLTAVLGGYDSARAIHHLAMLGLGVLVLAHVIASAVRWRTIPQMITGGTPETAEESSSDATT
jgi:thiosulfate reductase cytochrome b subunit